MDFLDTFITSRSAIVYLTFALLGVIATARIKAHLKKQRFSKAELGAIVSWSCFSLPAAILIDTHPSISFLIGLGSKVAWEVTQEKLPGVARGIVTLWLADGKKSEDKTDE